MPVEDINFNVPEYSAHVIEGNVDVGYSFASNPVDSSKTIQLMPNQLKINHIPETRSELPSLSLKEDEVDETDFRKKYVREDSEMKKLQSVQYNIQEDVDGPSVNLPNTSFEVKLIANEDKHEDNTFLIPETKPTIEMPKMAEMKSF